jgi:hypothetical protein
MHCVLGRHKAEADAWNKAVESDNRRTKFEINANLIQADQKGSVTRRAKSMSRGVLLYVEAKSIERNKSFSSVLKRSIAWQTTFAVRFIMNGWDARGR